jgi:hypothetical protein
MKNFRKTVALIILILFFLKIQAQQSFRINDFPRTFKGSIPNTFDKKINDTLTLHGVYKKPNYEISLVKPSGGVLCSCSYRVSDATEIHSGRDSTVQVKILEPVTENCIKKYRNLVDRRLE